MLASRRPEPYTQIMGDEKLWTREEALEKLRAINGSREKIKEWNDYRGMHLDWMPNLSDQDNPAYLHDVVLADTTHGADEQPLSLDLGLAILTSAVLTRANLTGVNLRRTDISDADLKSASLTKAELTLANLAGANLRSSRLEDAVLQNAKLSSANLRFANLCRVELSDADLTGAYLAFANLTSVILEKADLTDAELTNAMLIGAFLYDANLIRTDLQWTNLTDAKLTNANLTGASLMNANLTDADLIGANLKGADLSAVNLTDANVMGVVYSRREIRGKCTGARVATCFGNAVFKRDVEDEDFIDTLKHRLESERKIATRFWSKQKAECNLKLFRAWGWIDYGRSMWQASLYAIRFAFLFGVLFLFDMEFSWGLMDYSKSAHSLFTPFYYSIVTYTTLGFGDVTPLSLGGELFVVAEVILGYLTLGLLISILANKVARRS